MIQFIETFILLYLKYVFLYVFLYLLGRAFCILLIRLLNKEKKLPETLLNLNPKILYPLIGIVFLGNLLILLNYFFPIKDIIVVIITVSFLPFNLLEIKKDFEIKSYLTFNNFLYYFIFPSLLIVSSSNTYFHYDAGYYHLNHQNWLRESNMIFGMVNIFWPFGMSSIYEYISALFWTEGSFIFLHFLNLIFIHFFFLFISENLLTKQKMSLKIPSLFLIIFALLDNFGINGGRNGFLYIQGVGKQDIAVAVLYCFLTLTCLSYIKNKSVSNIDYVIVSLFTFFIFQLKVSGVVIFYVFILLNFFLLRERILTFNRIIYLQAPLIIFAISWFLKSYLTTGCIIFPLNITCINYFDWYVFDSTLAFQLISTESSLAFLEYFTDNSKTFNMWFNDFFYFSDNVGLSDFYRGVYLNFIFSFLFIFLIKKFFTTKSKEKMEFKVVVISYVILSILYLLFFGPIPRYTMGIMLTIIASLGYFANDFKFDLNRKLIYFLILISIGLVPRFNSYLDFYNNKDIAIKDPRTEVHYQEISTQGEWVKPDKGDRCWVNLKCSMNYEETILIVENGNFKTAYRLENSTK